VSRTALALHFFRLGMSHAEAADPTLMAEMMAARLAPDGGMSPDDATDPTVMVEMLAARMVDAPLPVRVAAVALVGGFLGVPPEALTAAMDRLGGGVDEGEPAVVVEGAVG
jgi:hypothetical protein